MEESWYFSETPVQESPRRKRQISSDTSQELLGAAILKAGVMLVRI